MDRRYCNRINLKRTYTTDLKRPRYELRFERAAVQNLQANGIRRSTMIHSVTRANLAVFPHDDHRTGKFYRKTLKLSLCKLQTFLQTNTRRRHNVIGNLFVTINRTTI